MSRKSRSDIPDQTPLATPSPDPASDARGDDDGPDSTLPPPADVSRGPAVLTTGQSDRPGMPRGLGELDGLARPAPAEGAGLSPTSAAEGPVAESFQGRLVAVTPGVARPARALPGSLRRRLGWSPARDASRLADGPRPSDADRPGDLRHDAMEAGRVSSPLATRPITRPQPGTFGIGNRRPAIAAALGLVAARHATAAGPGRWSSGAALRTAGGVAERFGRNRSGRGPTAGSGRSRPAAVLRPARFAGPAASVPVPPVPLGNGAGLSSGASSRADPAFTGAAPSIRRREVSWTGWPGLGRAALAGMPEGGSSPGTGHLPGVEAAAEQVGTELAGAVTTALERLLPAIVARCLAASERRLHALLEQASG